MAETNDINKLITVLLNEPQDELKAYLEKYIPSLESCQSSLEKTSRKAEEILNEVENKMREAVEFVHEQFIILREAINKKEKEIIQHLELNEATQEGINKLIYNARDLMCEMPTIIERVKTLLNGWNTKNEEITYVTEEISTIKEKVKKGKEMAEKLKALEDCETFVDTEKFVKGIKRGLNEINGIGEVPMKRMLCSAPTGFMANKVYSVYVTLYWGKGGRFDEYIISYREEGGKWSDNNELIHVDKKNDHCVVHPLKPETKYEFRLMGKIGEMETRWTETVSVKTEARFADLTIDSIVQELRINLDNVDNVDECIEILSNIASSTEGNGKNE